MFGLRMFGLRHPSFSFAKDMGSECIGCKCKTHTLCFEGLGLRIQSCEPE